MNLSSQFRFQKSVRLITTEQYSNIFQAVDFRLSSKHFLILACIRDLPEARLGLIVAKKNLKLAVDRNRIKRLIRESFRLQHTSLPKLDIIVLAKQRLKECSNAACMAELQHLWNELRKKTT